MKRAWLIIRPYGWDEVLEELRERGYSVTSA